MTDFTARGTAPAHPARVLYAVAAHDAADALAQIVGDLSQGADPELVLNGLHRAHLHGQLADIVTAVRDQLPDGNDVALTMAADHLRQAQHHLTGPYQS